MDVAGGWRTCFPACHNRLIVLQTPSVAPPELNRRATHAGTAPGRRQFRFAGAPRLQARRAAPLVSNTVSVRTGNALTSPESVILDPQRIYCWKTIGNHDFEWCSDWAQQCPRAPWISMPPLVREVRLSESMDLLTGFSRLLRWRNLSKDPSILFVELRGPAAAWSWVCDSGAPPSHHPKGEILLEVIRFVSNEFPLYPLWAENHRFG
jgi:hypothetical protein